MRFMRVLSPRGQSFIYSFILCKYLPLTQKESDLWIVQHLRKSEMFLFSHVLLFLTEYL